MSNGKKIKGVAQSATPLDTGSSPAFRTKGKLSNGAASEVSSEANREKYARLMRHCAPAQFSLGFMESPTVSKSKAMNTQHEPRLIKPSKDNKDQRWVVVYYLWSAARGKYVRKRSYKLNSVPEKERHLEFVFLKKELKQLQREAENSLIPETDLHGISLFAAIDLIIGGKSSLRPTTLKTYRDIAETFKGWLKNQAYTGKPEQFTRLAAGRYLTYLTDTRKVSNRTYNNHLNALKTIFGELNKLNVAELNVFAEIKPLPTDTGKNIAYTPEQTAELTRFMHYRAPELLFLCRFMYYSLMRTNEISRLQVKHIGMNRPDQIYLPAEWSKNRAARHITINEDFRRVIEESGVLSFPEDWYIFGKGFKPSPEYYPAKLFGNRYRRLVLDKLHYPKEHTLYSWKHTGVVMAYLNGVTPASIRMQIGHTDQTSFDTYLKSLGLFENTEIKTKFPKLPDHFPDGGKMM